MLLQEQAREITFSRRLEPGKQLALLEIEMPRDVAVDVAGELRRQAAESGLAEAPGTRGAAAGLLDPAQQIERGAVLLLEHVVYLSLQWGLRHRASIPR